MSDQDYRNIDRRQREDHSERLGKIAEALARIETTTAHNKETAERIEGAQEKINDELFVRVNKLETGHARVKGAAGVLVVMFSGLAGWLGFGDKMSGG